MPRAQRTKSAVHEALQRRVGERPGDSFSGLFGGGSRLGLPYSARNEMVANPMLVLEADAQQLSLSPPFPDERGACGAARRRRSRCTVARCSTWS